MKQKLLFFKTFLLIAIMTMFGTNSWAAEVTLSAGTHDGSSITWTLNDGSTTAVTIKQLKGAGTAVNSNYISAPRVYRANLLSFEAASGYAITNISISYTSTYKGTTITSGTSMNGNDVISNTTDINQTLSTASNGTHTFASTSSAGLPAIYIQNGTTSATNTQLRITKIDVTFVTTGGGSKTSTTTSFATASYSFDINSAQYNAFTGQTASVSDGSSTISGATLTYSTTDTSVAAVNASTGAVTLGTKIGTATITASYAGDDNYDGSSATYTITLTYPYVHAGTAADPFTVAEAVAKAQENGTTASGPWYTTGIVAQVDDVNTSYGNAQYWISDDGTTSGAMLEIYRGKYLDNTSFTSNDQIQVGDEVVVTGNLLNYNNSTPEYAANNYLVSLSRGGLADAEFAFPQASYTAVLGGSFTAPALSTASGYDGTPQYVSSDTGVATVDASTGAVTIVGVGTTTITASAVATSNFAADEASYTLVVVSKLSPELTVSPNTLTVAEGAADGTVTVTTASGYAGTITVSSDDTSVATATYSAGEITVVYGSAGTATLTVTAAAAGDYEAQTQTIAVTVNVPSTSGDFTWDLSTNEFSEASTEQVTWTSSFATMVADKASSSTYTNNYLGGENSRTSTRFYTNSTLTITPVSGYKITSIEFTATTNSYASALANSTWSNATASADETTVTVTPVDGTVAIVATIGATTGHTGVTVYYEAVASSSVLPPTFSPASGAVAAGTSVTISSAAGTTITYTTDGTDPETSATATMTSTNSATVTVTTATTIRAIAMDDELNISTEATAIYTISVAAPVFTPGSCAVTAGATVSIEATGAAMILYTTDGTDPDYSTGNGTEYSTPIAINEATTIKAVAYDSYGNASEVVTANYTLRTTGVINLTRQLVFEPETSGLSKSSYASNDEVSEMSGTFSGDATTTTFGGFTFKDVYAPQQSSVYYIQMKANTGSITFPTINSAYGFDVTINYAVNEAVTTIDNVETTGTSATAATLKIETGSSYCRINSITLTPRTEAKISVTLAEVEMGTDKVYAGTYYNPTSAYLMPTGMTGYTITEANGEGGVLTLNPVYAEGSEVPAAEPLLITSATSQSNVSLTLVTEPTATNATGNLLKGSPGAGVMISGDSDHYYYKLSKSKSTGKPGFFWGNATGEPFEMAKATSCYLEVAKPSSGEPMRGFSFGTDFTTAISLVTQGGAAMPQVIYDLQGRRVAKVQKGLYIVNGKKVMVK